MPTPTYIPLATVTLGSSASSVTFSSIPATYRDLVLVINGTTSVAALGVLTVNSDTTDGNYSRVDMRGDSGGAISTTGADRFFMSIDSTQSSSAVVQFMDYSATDKHKTYLVRSSYVALQTRAWAFRWANTAAITTLGFTLTGGVWNTGSTFNLYGIGA